MPFSGRAVYTSGVFNLIADDVSPEISMISPTETPLLDILGDANREAHNVLHEWVEESLGPNTFVNSTSINANSTAMGIHDGSGNAMASYLQAGMIVKNVSSGEFIQVVSVSGNTVTVTRGFGGTTAATVAQTSWYIISDAALEGADVATDISVARSRRTNYCQIFKKDIIVSGTMQAVTNLGGIEDEYEHQKMARIKESIRDLEKAVINGISSGNTIGSASAYRTFDGIWNKIQTNITSLTTISSIEQLEAVIETAWNKGAQDLDLIVVDSTKKRQLAALQGARLTVEQSSSAVDVLHKDVSFVETSFGRMAVLRSRWMPSNSLMVISSGRVKVLPLRGRSFVHEEVSRTGDAKKGMIVGEYTVEVNNEDGMAKAF